MYCFGMSYISTYIFQMRRQKFLFSFAFKTWGTGHVCWWIHLNQRKVDLTYYGWHDLPTIILWIINVLNWHWCLAWYCVNRSRSLCIGTSVKFQNTMWMRRRQGNHTIMFNFIYSKLSYFTITIWMIWYRDKEYFWWWHVIWLGKFQVQLEYSSYGRKKNVSFCKFFGYLNNHDNFNVQIIDMKYIVSFVSNLGVAVNSDPDYLLWNKILEISSFKSRLIHVDSSSW